MLLSQLAWKIGCAFTSGRQSAPAEFQEVENELTSLTKAITLLTEVLDRDDSILGRADERTKDGLDKILECCRQVSDDSYNIPSILISYRLLRTSMLSSNSIKKFGNQRVQVVSQFNGCGNRYSFETTKRFGGQLKAGIFRL